MFKGLKRIVYQVSDITAARAWYSKILDTQPAFDSKIAVIYRVGECSLSLRQSASLCDTQLERTETFWEVNDTDRAFNTLIESGAQVFSPPKTILNIRIAQVKDPFGNILGLSSFNTCAGKLAVDNNPSESAMTVTFCRALAARDERAEIRGSDNLAELFLSDELRQSLNDVASRKAALQNLSSLYGGLIARTAYVDSLFETALSDQIAQIVILGAGYDSRPYRFKNRIGTTRIFEVDAHSTQSRKLSILKESGIEYPDKIAHVAVDFTKDSLSEKLTSADYKDTEQTLFIWEGVMYYLSEDAVRRTLQCIQSHSPEGSTLFLDYMTEKMESVYSAEPFRFWSSPEAIKNVLHDYGITIIETLTAAELQSRYLTMSDGTLAENALQQFHFIHAVRS